jgi:transcriptional regulator with XRE-family HTH domain
MKENGVNASRLVTDLGLHVSAVTEWKHGKSKPSTEAIVKIADYFSVTTDYLLTGKETQQPQNEGKGIIMAEKNLTGDLRIGLVTDRDDLVVVEREMQELVSKLPFSYETLQKNKRYTGNA